MWCLGLATPRGVAPVETLSTLCTQHPLALPVLHELGCVIWDPEGSVEACCEASGVEPARLVLAIVGAEREVAALDDGSIDGLLDAIVRRFHRPFAHEVTTLTTAIDAAHQATRLAGWSKLGAELVELSTDLDHHIEMEERVVFPWLRGRTASASQTIRGLQLEHGDAMVHLLTIEAHAQRCLVESPGVPAAGAAVAVLHAFERWLCEHIHAESNSLFPLALQAELGRR